MTAPNIPPRRVSMAYILGFSNKPFKDPKPPPPPPLPPQPGGYGDLVSTPGGFVEWAASDGRKGKLKGPGKARVEDNRSKKATSEKGANTGTVAAGDEAVDEDNPHGFTAEQDNKLVDWKSKNEGKAWALCAEEVGKSGDQCKERFKQLNTRNGAQSGGNDQGGKTGGGDAQQDSSQKKLTKHEKKVAKKEYDQNRNQNRRQGNNKDQGSKNEQTSGNDWNATWGNTAGNNDDGGIMGILNPDGDGDGDKKDSNENNNDTTGLWPNEGAATNDPFAPGGTATSWDKNNGSGSKKDGEDNKGANGWGGAVNDSKGNASGDAAADAWGAKSGNDGNKSANGWGGAVNDSTGNASGDAAADAWGAKTGKDSDNKGTEKLAWDTGGGSGDANATAAWDQPASQKPASNSGGAGGWNDTGGGGGNDTAADGGWNKTSGDGGWNTTSGDGGWNKTSGDGGWDKKSKDGGGNNTAGGGGWNDTGGDGANDATSSPWDTNQKDTSGNNNGGFDNSWGAPAKSASKAASKAPTHRHTSHHAHQSTQQKSTHEHHSTKVRPLELEVKPDETFSSDDLRLVARILQQDYQTVWNRVSWRFKDKTGRHIAPDVFEKKITGRVESKGSERGGKRK